MIRIYRSFPTEAIVAALDVIPAPILARMPCAFVAGVDPIWCGLTPATEAVAEDGRSLCDTAHVCWPYHLAHRPVDERVCTIALPVPEVPWVIVHELGHVLHWYLDLAPTFAPVTRYAAKNKYEAFAEAFAAWLMPTDYHVAQDALAQSGAPEFFDGLL